MAQQQVKNPWTIHHLHPRSRCLTHELRHATKNKLRVRQVEHNAFHRLFSNMVPVEMIRHLLLHWAKSSQIRFTKIDICAEYGAVYRSLPIHG